MGGAFDRRVYKGNLSREELRKRFAQTQEEDREENGHSYSGSIGMCDGLVISEHKFDSIEKAEDWLCDHTEKWGSAKAVRVGDMWVVGGWCSE